MLAATLEAEHMPYTQNGHYLETTTQAWLDKYKAVRSGHSPEVESDTKAKKQKIAQSTPFVPFWSAPATGMRSNLSYILRG